MDNEVAYAARIPDHLASHNGRSGRRYRTIYDTHQGGTNTEPVEVFVDFSLVGNAIQFRTWLPAAERAALHDGQEVVVYGDAVDAMLARVLHVTPDDPEVELQLLGCQ